MSTDIFFNDFDNSSSRLIDALANQYDQPHIVELDERFPRVVLAPHASIFQSLIGMYPDVLSPTNRTLFSCLNGEIRSAKFNATAGQIFGLTGSFESVPLVENFGDYERVGQRTGVQTLPLLRSIPSEGSLVDNNTIAVPHPRHPNQILPFDTLISFIDSHALEPHQLIKQAKISITYLKLFKAQNPDFDISQFTLIISNLHEYTSRNIMEEVFMLRAEGHTFPEMSNHIKIISQFN